MHLNICKVTYANIESFNKNITSDALQRSPVPTTAITSGFFRVFAAYLNSSLHTDELAYSSDTQTTTTFALIKPSAMSANKPF